MTGAARSLARTFTGSAMRGLARVLWLALGLTLVGCGSNTPTIPPELLENSGGCASPDYPSGPFGTEEGDTLGNLCFKGFRNPAVVSHNEASLETIAFSDYYDPTGSKGLSLLLINTSAVWCAACRTEHEGLSAKNAQYSGRGLRILSTLFQDNMHDPATIVDLKNWVETFSSNYAMALDPDYQLGEFARAETAPLNLVVDARTMNIEKKLLGDQPQVMWPFIDASLPEP